MAAINAFIAKHAKAMFRNKRTVKTWLRCCITLAVSLIFLVATDLTNLLGQAAFFTAILSVMLTPSLALTMFILASATLVIGMCLGWAWGIAAIAAANSVRDQARLQQQIQEVQASFVDGIPVAFQYQSAIFHGKFLDTRSSVVFGVFLFIGTFFLATVSAYRPKLALLTIFATIILDVQCSYSPSFPTPNYTIARMILIPSGFYLAVAVGALLLIFPESLNHVWLTMLGDVVLKPVSDILSIQAESLAVDPTNKSVLEDLVKRGDITRQMLIAGFQGLEGQIALVGLEFSVGRLSAADLSEINKLLKSLTIRSSGLLTFQSTVNDMLAAHAKDDSESLQKNRNTTLRRSLKEREAKHGHGLSDLMPVLSVSAAPLLEACTTMMQTVDSWVTDCNSGRWTWLVSKPSLQHIEDRHEAIVDALQILRQASMQFRDAERVKLIKPFEKCFDPTTGRPLGSAARKEGAGGHPDFSVRSLFVCFVFCDTLEAFAETLLNLGMVIERIDSKRPKPRVWMPIGIGSIGGKVKGTQGGLATNSDVSPFAMGAPTNPYKFDNVGDVPGESQETLKNGDLEEGLSINRRDPDALPPHTASGRLALKLAAVVRFLRSHEGIFALRYAVVSIALWIPTVCASSAWFTYTNRGLWALIMAQTGLSVFAGDQIFSFVVRLTGTIIGLLVGVVCWYIGAGNGNGNPYGIAIATTFFTSPFLLFSITNTSPALRPFWTMISVTSVFVVGYSWVDSHLPVLGSPGVGIDIAWKRALLIIIGFTAGFIVMVIPSMTSSRVFVRKSLAAVLDELAHILAAEVEAFLAEERRARDGYYEKVEIKMDGGEGAELSPKERRMRKFTPKMLAVATRLQEIQPSLQSATWEPQVRGKWPAAKYQALHNKTRHILSSLTLLVGAFSRLDTKWCSILVHHTPFLNPNFLADVFMHVSILSSALANGTPLPPTVPSLRERLLYHEAHLKRRDQQTQNGSEVAKGSHDVNDGASETTDDSAAPGKVDGSTIGFKELSLDILLDPQLPPHSTALIALSNTITLLDEVSALVKDLCGETNFPSLDMLHRHWLTVEEEAKEREA